MGVRAVVLVRMGLEVDPVRLVVGGALGEAVGHMRRSWRREWTCSSGSTMARGPCPAEAHRKESHMQQLLAVRAVDLSSPRRHHAGSVVGQADDSVGDQQAEQHFRAVALLACNRTPEEPLGAE